MTLSMKKLNCDIFQITIEFNEKIFKSKEFLAEFELKRKKHFAFVTTFGSKYKSKNEHAHIYLDLDGEGSELRIGFHSGKVETEKDNDRFIEDMSEWLGGFFRAEDLDCEITSFFLYGKKFESQLPLNYPLLIKNEYLKGTNIVGYDINFPEESLLSRANVVNVKKGLLVLMIGETKINLPTFDYLSEIANFSKYANALVKEKEGE